MSTVDSEHAARTPRESATPRISVVTAVYNSEKTVANAIQSVAAQDYPDVEHLVVDGRSSDGSLAEIERVTHERLRVVSEPDRGIYDALNKGVRMSSGDVIGFVHADDFLANSRVLSRIADAFRDPAVDAVFGDLDYVSQREPGRIVRRWSTGAFKPARLKWGWMPAHPTLYLRRRVYEKFGGFDDTLSIAADYEFILRCFSGGALRSVYLPEVLYKMRLGGVSNRDWPRIRLKMREDLLALRRHGIGGVPTLVFKNLSKLGQFLPR